MTSQQHSELVGYVLDNPEEAALEIKRLRQLKTDLIPALQLALAHLTAPMPHGRDVMSQSGEYAERCGYARGTITFALEELQK